MALSNFWSEAVQLAPSILPLFTGNQKTKAQKQQEESIARQQQLISDAYNPNSAIYKQQVAVDEAGRRADYAKSIQELMAASRKNTYMGRNPLLDPERADEILSRLEQQGYTNAARDARINATNTILGMANAQGNIGSQYANMVPSEQTRYNNRGAQINVIADMLSKRILNRTSPDASMPKPQDIIWNTPRQQGRVVMSEQPPPRSEGQVIFDSLMSRSGGQNSANTLFNQLSQYNGTRSNRGGRSFA